MADDIITLIGQIGVSATAGAGLMKLVNEYQKRTSKSDKAALIKKMYDELEDIYAKDVDLQKRLNELALENIKLKRLIKKLKDDFSNKS